MSQPKIPTKRWLTVREVLRFFEIAEVPMRERTLQRWCRSGKVVARATDMSTPENHRQGNPWLIDIESIRMSDFGRELYEECMIAAIGAVNSEGL